MRHKKKIELRNIIKDDVLYEMQTSKAVYEPLLNFLTEEISQRMGRNLQATPDWISLQKVMASINPPPQKENMTLVVQTFTHSDDFKESTVSITTIT